MNPSDLNKADQLNKALTAGLRSMQAVKNSTPRARRRNFAAAKTPDILSGWTSTPLSIDAAFKTARKTLIARSREQALNNDYIKRFLSMNVSNIIGHVGIKLRSNVRTLKGEPDRMARPLIEDSWQRWGRLGVPTVDGLLSWHDVEKLIVRTTPQDGGVLIRHVPGFPNDWGYAIQILEVDHINTDMDNVKTREGNIIRMGVEKTPYGRPVAYHIYTTNPGDQSYFISHDGRVSIRVPAEEIEYIYLPQRPGQTHGYPWAHSAIITLKHLGLYREAAVIEARLGASKNTYFVQKTDTPMTTPEHDDEDEDGTQIDEIEPGERQFLPPGVEPFLVDPNNPNTAHSDFENAILKGAASGLDVSFVTLANNLEKVNFSSIRQGVLDERNNWRLLQRFYAEHLHDRIFMRWLPMALVTDLAPALRLADFQRLSSSRWRPRGWDWVDPQKDMNANTQAVDLAVKSRQEIAEERGRDFYEVLEELKEEQEAAAAAGVKISGAGLTQVVPEPDEDEEDDDK